MQDEIKLRPHHVTNFAHYYLNNASVTSGYGQEFKDGVTSLFEILSRKGIGQVTIINGLDDICKICMQTTKRKNRFCEKGDNLQRNPSALVVMAKTQLVVGQIYNIHEFLERVERIRKKYTEEELLDLMMDAYANMGNDPRF